MLRKKKEKGKNKKGGGGTLSFNIDDDDHGAEGSSEEDRGDSINVCFHKSQVLLTELSPPVIKKRKMGKNPDVDTSFLPDRDREVSLYQENNLLCSHESSS